MYELGALLCIIAIPFIAAFIENLWKGKDDKL